ncbi:hypothetical protein E4Z66_10785 [Aliishimia ponticola]|uniref:DUF995 domain-containing protein n=1 Tax=Aliishimia ponticola TaxID=2499833 RepID=A0A4S4ND36_9RHOB|nr:hypothetical protein [Aliishimia ponticola]THH37386.1 hypothetical protein E4Z66_10785 [Aliishimia ponticola]
MRWIALMALLAAAQITRAAEPMSPAQFEAYVTGKTLFYGQQGRAYGAEIYLENRQVRWSFLDGECKDGHWYPVDEKICFVYEDRLDPQCWTFFLQSGGLSAKFEGNPDAPELYEAQDLGEEMLCLGPKVGV